MHPLLRFAYDTAAALAELSAKFVSADATSKFGRSLVARRGLLERYEAFGRTGRDRSRPLLWMHAPSVGEGLMARPVLELLRAAHPEWQIAYSWYSPSAENFGNSLGADFADYLPFDRRASMRTALEALSPTVLAFAKVDLWPALVEEAVTRGTKVAMISATMSAGAGRAGAAATALLGKSYGALSAVGAVDAADAERLVTLGVRRERIEVTGDTRYDQVLARTAGVDRAGALLAPLVSERPTLVAGSTWPADEAPLLAAWLHVKRAVPSARLIIAPHEPTAAHLEPIQRWATTAGLRVDALGAASDSSDVVLVDRVGVLGELYALADLAYVGGGFHSAGLHSVVEPAAFAVPVLFGPKYEESRDAMALLAAGGGRSADSSEELSQMMIDLFQGTEARQGAGASAARVVEGGRGAAGRSAALIQRLFVALLALVLSFAIPRAVEAQRAEPARPVVACDYQSCAYNIIAALHGLRVVKGSQETQVATLGFLWTRDISSHFEGPGHEAARASVRTRRWGAVLTDVGLGLLAAGAVRALAKDGDKTSDQLMLAGAAGLVLSVPLQFRADKELARAVWQHNARYAPAR